MTKKRRQSSWGKRTFTPAQWIKRDLRGATTVSAKAMKSGKRPITLAKINIVDDRK